MNFDITHGGRITLAVDYTEAVDLGYPASVIAATMKAKAKQKVATFADDCRAILASNSAGKLAEYRIKAEIARDPNNSAVAELALIDREAVARGTDRAGLIAQINSQAAVFRQIALLIGVIEAETCASITAIPDDALNIEMEIETVLAAAKSLADDVLLETQTSLAT